MKFIKKHRIILAFFLIVLLKLYLVSDLYPYIELNYTYDDSLYINIIKSMGDGNWLGSYNELTIVKGILFPLFVMLISIVKIPYLLGLDILYITSITLLVLSLKKYIKEPKWLLLIFVVLLFNPISYASETYLKFYRNGFNISIIIIFFAALINCFDFYKYSIKNQIAKISLLSLSVILVFNTREDFYWIIPAIIILIIYNFINLAKNKKKILLFLLIPVSIYISNSIISIINYKYYNTYTYNELTKSSFSKAYKTLLSVNGDKKYDQVTLSNTDLKKIAENSPTFKLLYDSLDGHQNIIDGTLLWILRTKAQELGYYKDAKTANDFWNKIDFEINVAFNEKRLIKNTSSVISPLIAPLRKSYIMSFPITYIKAFVLLTTYSDLEINNKKSFGSEQDIMEFSKITNQKLDINDTQNPNSGIIKLTVLKVIGVLYQIFIPLLMIVSFALLIFNILNKKQKLLQFISFVLLFSILINIAGITYTHLSAFDALNYYYLSPLYNLVLVFIIINFYIYHTKNSI